MTPKASPNKILMGLCLKCTPQKHKDGTAGRFHFGAAMQKQQDIALDQHYLFDTFWVGSSGSPFWEANLSIFLIRKINRANIQNTLPFLIATRKVVYLLKGNWKKAQWYTNIAQHWKLISPLLQYRWMLLLDTVT